MKHIFSFKYAILYLLFAGFLANAFLTHQSLKLGMLNAMEASLKKVYVNESNEVCLDRTEALLTLNKYIQSNLGLNESLYPINSKDSPYASALSFDSIEIFDATTTGLPITINEKVFNSPTMHLKVTINVKVLFAKTFGLNVSYPVHLDLIESNEPPSL